MIEKLHKDLLAFATGLPLFIVKDLAPQLLREITSNPDFPYESGTLKSSGFAYVEGGLVGRSGGAAPSTSRPASPPRIAKVKDRVTISFTTPKAATEGAKEFYTQAGVRLFDYAPHVHEGGFVEHRYHATKYVDSYINMFTMAPIISQTLDKKWSKRQ